METWLKFAHPVWGVIIAVVVIIGLGKIFFVDAPHVFIPAALVIAGIWFAVRLFKQKNKTPWS